MNPKLTYLRQPLSPADKRQNFYDSVTNWAERKLDKHESFIVYSLAAFSAVGGVVVMLALWSMQ